MRGGRRVFSLLPRAAPKQRTQRLTVSAARISEPERGPGAEAGRRQPGRGGGGTEPAAVLRGGGLAGPGHAPP
jgi:hypothetical protein